MYIGRTNIYIRSVSIFVLTYEMVKPNSLFMPVLRFSHLDKSLSIAIVGKRSEEDMSQLATS